MVEGKGAKLLVNSRTGRGAVQRRARSVTDDDGAIHPRLRLVWPLSDSVVPAETLLASQWEEADRDTCSAAWEAELAGLPTHETSTLPMVSGLLLPIWRRLPDESTRVSRRQSDDGERLIGRRASPAGERKKHEEGKGVSGRGS